MDIAMKGDGVCGVMLCARDCELMDLGGDCERMDLGEDWRVSEACCQCTRRKG